MTDIVAKKRRRGKRAGKKVKAEDGDDHDQHVDAKMEVAQDNDNNEDDQVRAPIKEVVEEVKVEKKRKIEDVKPEEYEEEPHKEHEEEEEAQTKEAGRQKRGKRGGKKKRKVETTSNYPSHRSEEAPVDHGDTQNQEQQNYNNYNATDYAEGDSYDQESAHKSTGGNGGDLFNSYDQEMPDFGAVPSDTLTYFTSIEKMLDDQPFETDEDRYLFVRNVYKEVGTHDVKLAGDYSCSLILEKLLRNSTDGQVRRVAKNFLGMYADLFRHRFASHVIQTLLTLSSSIINREVTGVAQENADVDEEDEEKVPSMSTLFIDMCNELDGQWHQLMLNNWASHLVRVALNVASGEMLIDKANIVRSKKSTKYITETVVASNATGTAGAKEAPKHHKKRVPLTFKPVLEQICTSILSNLSESDIRTLASHSVGSPVLQLLLRVPSSSKLILDALMSKDGGAHFLSELAKDKVGSHLLERVISVISPEDLQTLWVDHFKPHAVQFAFHPTANFVLQHVIAKVDTADQMKTILEGLGPKIDQLLFNQRAGVVVNILDGCLKVKECQKEAFEAVVKAFGAELSMQGVPLISLILYMQKKDTYEAHTGTRKCNYHGAMLLEKLLLFEADHNRYLVESFLSIPVEETTQWAFDSIGSHVYEHILKSPTVALKSKKKLLFNLVGRYCAMAKDKYGSRLVDQCWLASDLLMKEKIATELAKEERALSNNFHGKFVIRNCSIELFKRNKDEWVQRQKGVSKKLSLFAGII
ncbi:Nucleolar protein 9 [Chytridiales sp. JEL 0842]|nr:Nucleolar protein 9 [Chytridiales sp. JEL 0842]